MHDIFIGFLYCINRFSLYGNLVHFSVLAKCFFIPYRNMLSVQFFDFFREISGRNISQQSSIRTIYIISVRIEFRSSYIFTSSFYIFQGFIGFLTLPCRNKSEIHTAHQNDS